jgi:hypothetical protein
LRDGSAEPLNDVAIVGCGLCCEDGLGDGSAEGLDVGALLREELGFADGLGDGSGEGFGSALFGEELGFADGLGDGSGEGLDVGALFRGGVGRAVGLGDGSVKRLVDGALMGEELGFAYELDDVSSEAEGLDDADDRRVEGLDDGNVLFRTGAVVVVVGLIEKIGGTVVETEERDGFFVGEVLAAIEVDGPGGDEGVELAEFDVAEDDDGVCDGARNCCCKVGFGDCPGEVGVEIEGSLVINKAGRCWKKKKICMSYDRKGTIKYSTKLYLQ